MKAFISYSHKDASHLERLHTHLAMLKREGKIIAWYDREILAGGSIDAEINAQLEQCELFLALVSPDFIASSYCYETEMQKAFKLHDAGKARIVPIILEPCDWQSTPLKKLKAIPRDGKAISEWTNQNTAFLDVVNELRRIVENLARPANDTPVATSSVPQKEARRYRTKRDFDEIDRSDFRREAFETIRKYLQASIEEINGIEDIKARFTNIGPQSFSCTVLNRGKDRGLGALTVHLRSGLMGFSDIYYSNEENAPPNTSNGGFSVEADEYNLFLKQAFSFSGDANQRLTATQVAEILWKNLLEQAGVSYA